MTPVLLTICLSIAYNDTLNSIHNFDAFDISPAPSCVEWCHGNGLRVDLGH